MRGETPPSLPVRPNHTAHPTHSARPNHPAHRIHSARPNHSAHTIHSARPNQPVLPLQLSKTNAHRRVETSVRLTPANESHPRDSKPG